VRNPFELGIARGIYNNRHVSKHIQTQSKREGRAATTATTGTPLLHQSEECICIQRHQQRVKISTLFSSEVRNVHCSMIVSQSRGNPSIKRRPLSDSPQEGHLGQVMSCQHHLSGKRNQTKLAPLARSFGSCQKADRSMAESTMKTM
jgi:hypothetical protein